MRREELTEIVRLACDMNNAYVEVRQRGQAVSDAKDRFDAASKDLRTKRTEFLKKMGVGPNIQLKTVRLPDSDFTVVVRWTDAVTEVMISGPEGAKEIA